MLPARHRVSLGAGGTPLVPVQLAEHSFLAKLEYCNPTGSFKDRGTELMINHFLAHDVESVVEDSSGNAGASLAAYAAAAGIQARIFAPASAPAAKQAHIRAYGAELVTVPGPRAAAAETCLAAAETAVYASHAWSPFFVAGQMTCAWEIFEQCGAPDAILCCAGHGGLFTGLARGFQALQAAGLIEQLPRMVVAQAAACDPLVQAWERGFAQTMAVTPEASVADGISVAQPVHGAEILRTLRATGGAALRVSEEEVLAAQKITAGAWPAGGADQRSARGSPVERTRATAGPRRHPADRQRPQNAGLTRYNPPHARTLAFRLPLLSAAGCNNHLAAGCAYGYASGRLRL